MTSWDENIWPPFTQIASSTPQRRVLSGKNALLELEGQPSVIDAISSWWVTLHGHSNKYVANAIAEQAKQLEQVIFADFKHPQAERLAKRLGNLTGLQRLFFSDNGSTAVEVALKIACQYWQNKNEPRHQIIAFEGAYHGDTFGAMAVGERNLFNESFEDKLFPVSRVPWPATWWGDADVEKKENNVIESLERLLQKPTAAVILEPLVQGAGGMAMVRAEFLKKVEKVVKESKALLIADEVMTGFGRCGSLFASHRANISPDLMSLSKGLTSGFLPMGVTMAKEEIFQTFIGEDPRLTFWHGHSFTANPLGCAAANASLDLLEKTPLAYTSFESRHLPHLQKLVSTPKVTKPRLTGTIAAFDIKANGRGGYLNAAGKALKKYALDHDVFIRPLGNVVYLLPPLCISDSQLEKCYTTIEKGLEEL
ncbi:MULTISPECIES: adenosylmethionine--8-amino-7-oxononanoate transaminase [Prochlorococcus]|uniref:adenosylmethionine--8-amino-7-oxononanoate transaminase n=1 Tax=Prochlorococcus TaxID=1218 RepID=UPI0005337A6F|nr:MULTISPECIES: adenosylmethionine--8-amino-7-oxononanoate transaminase [Prochlorococcus]KGG13501.1 Adenosylmethionine-8-amino-7-oxononanoate aminotransferase [Prochlorococcus sp. MIT 0601]